MKPFTGLNAVLSRAGRYLFALSFSFYVLLHLSLPEVGVKLYVPGYLPFPYFGNYFTGLCLLAFIVSSLLGKWDKLSALLLVAYLVLVAVLIHLPKALFGTDVAVLAVQ
jgi:uncharacterized membrane protein